MNLKRFFLITLSIVPLFAVVYEQPQQVHLSFGADPTQMIVTWVTFDEIPNPIVEYGINELNKKAFGKSTKFIDGGSEKRKIFVHRVIIKNLKPSKKYQYHCGSDYGWSPVYKFVAMPNGSDWSPRFAVYGDMGNANAQSIPRLQSEAQKGMYDAILHVGDFAYDFDSENARVGDEFMRQIEPIAAYVPYMTCPGNHEQKYNFSNYDNRFSMVNSFSGEMNNHFYSFNIGSAHIVSFSTEFYYYTKYGWNQIEMQYKWLENDLKEANKPENRAQRPWIITMGHKPLYCSTFDFLCEFQFQRKLLRKGIRMRNQGPVVYGLEDLFYKYGVDLQLYGHEHNYQRLFPVYNNEVMNGTKDNPYKNPKAPVHIITGSAGCDENHARFLKNLPDWSAFRSEDYGYTRMTIYNKTHILLEQVSDDQNGKIIDRINVIKEKHGPNEVI